MIDLREKNENVEAHNLRRFVADRCYSARCICQYVDSGMDLDDARDSEVNLENDLLKSDLSKRILWSLRCGLLLSWN